MGVPSEFASPRAAGEDAAKTRGQGRGREGPEVPAGLRGRRPRVGGCGARVVLEGRGCMDNRRGCLESRRVEPSASGTAALGFEYPVRAAVCYFVPAVLAAIGALRKRPQATKAASAPMARVMGVNLASPRIR